MRGDVLRFLAIGALNTAFGYGVFVALSLTLDGNAAAVVLSTIAGVLFNYVSYGQGMFGGRRSWASFGAHAVYYTIVCIANIVALERLVSSGLSPQAGQLLIVPVIAAVTYAVNKLVIYRL